MFSESSVMLVYIFRVSLVTIAQRHRNFRKGVELPPPSTMVLEESWYG